ncbi:MAG: HPF/RaiA family ribosome-associated protein [Candidatus Peregrinibacteria bacterium]
MQVTFFQKNLSKQEESAFADYVNQKTDAFEGLLKKFAPEAQLLKASIEKFDKHDAYEVEFYLTLPIKSMIAQEASHTIRKAVDLAADRLTIQIKKHKAHLTKNRTHKSIRQVEAMEKEKVY